MEQNKFTLGGALWINLANTIMMQDGKKADVLKEPANIRRWLEENGLLNGEIDEAPTPDSIEHELALLREICTDTISDIVTEGRLSDQTFSRLAKKSSELVVDVCIDIREDRLALIHEGRGLAGRVGYAVLNSLVETIGKFPPERIRKCEHEACIIHFVDSSKSGKRRWCSMDLCGNRQKAAEFYARRKERLGR
ncbi:CGNR zinc finger domain-containing protein [Paenibacillus alkalitolerans]|uniref:CGNR zinc finger domain-containing protein n=1 Tax=Paenibacillus alkalitolerans TaxID=2799335 RepID=UPI0018F60F8F|nr:CGNR zinc finger domain-containing protein [Paenibacillus alkalitolerans]